MTRTGEPFLAPARPSEVNVTIPAKRVFKRHLKGLQYGPRVIVTDKLRSCGVAQRHLLPGVEHRQSRYLNNRAENSHRPTRRRERRCNGLNRPSRPRASSLLTQSFMATSIHAENSWQPPPTAQSGPRHSMSGSRRRALSIRRDQQCNRPPGPTSPLEVNVTLPLSTTMPSGRMMGSLAETIRYMIRLSRPPFAAGSVCWRACYLPSPPAAHR